MKRVRVKPGKGPAMFGGIVGLVFVIIGLVLVVPTFGLFGIFWTLIAAAICGMSFYSAVSKKGVVSHEIEFDIDDEGTNNPQSAGSSQTVEQRLARLNDLYERRVITREEYEAQRTEIIKHI